MVDHSDAAAGSVGMRPQPIEDLNEAAPADGVVPVDPPQSPLPGKNPMLVPTLSLTSEEFEDFTERLLSAHRFCVEPLRRVSRVERWGRRGDKQDGIDFEGEFSDGVTAGWQCKRYDKLTVSDVRDAVRACTFTADEYYLVFSGEASSTVRDEIAKHPKWHLLDQRGLGRLLDDLPLHKRRDVLDATWGVQQRKLLLEVPGEDAFLSLDTFAADRQDPNTVLNDLGPWVGRETELAALTGALDRSGDWPLVVLVTGPGGRGKTRLLVEALTQFQRDNSRVPVICLSPGRSLDAAALAELPHTPAVIFVDDAHRDSAAIAPLLPYVRAINGTQLVLASRSSGAESLRGEVVNARYALSQVETVAVDELTRKQARALVDSLTDGLGLPLAAREYFADQAIDSPFIAVIGANLIRRGDLTAPLAVDAGLREQVLARYHDLASGDLDGSAERRVLAVYAALAPVNDADDELRTAIARFCDMAPVELMRLSERLHDRGVLVTRSGGTRVVPDVLADYILEREAVVGQHDTGFTVELWEIFGSTHGERLVMELAELDWRLARRGGPSVFAPVWASVREELRAADHENLCHALGKLSGLTATQPSALFEVLEEIRQRLDVTEVVTTNAVGEGSTEAPVTDAEQRDVELSSGSDQRAQFGLEPIGADDVRQLLPDLYGQCVANAPELLETALDALWALRRRDPRPTHQHPEHAERVLADQLADPGHLPDESFPARIIARVDAWLSESADDQDVTTPMFALRPLLAKDGYHAVPENQRRISLRPFLVSPTWAQPVRDAIRMMLRRYAGGVDLRRAGAAVDLLGEALCPPRGGFGYSVTNADVVAWEDDDLATLAVLAEAAQSAGSAVVRRRIRHQIAWTSRYALSFPVRHAALTLLTELDERDDDLAGLLLNNRGTGYPSRRGTAVPTLDDIATAEAAQAEREAGLTEEQLQAAQLEQARQLVETRDAAHRVLLNGVMQNLTASNDPAHIVDTLDECAREIRAVDPQCNPSLWSLWAHLGENRPDLAAGTVQNVANRPAGPLDENLDPLLNAWAQNDEIGVLAWLANLSEYRTEVRLAVATAFVNFAWTSRGSAFEEVHHRGIHDPNPSVRDRFLMGSHTLLKIQPTSTVEILLTGGISPSAATVALQLACDYNGTSWGCSLSAADAVAVLKLIDHTGWKDDTIQHIAAGIATTYPKLVLDHLTAARRARHQLPTEVAGFAQAFDERAEALSQWMVDQTQQSQPMDAAAVIDLVMAHGITTRQAEHLSDAIDSLDGDGLLVVVALLSDVAIWPLRQSSLARSLIFRAREIGADVTRLVRKQIADAMRLRFWSGVNGASSDLEQARTLVAHCVATENDPELKQDFEQTLGQIQDQITRDLRRHQEREDP